MVIGITGSIASGKSLVTSYLINKGYQVIDSDKISLTNVNRQIHATLKTIGRSKVEVMKERMLDINPECNITVYEEGKGELSVWLLIGQYRDAF